MFCTTCAARNPTASSICADCGTPFPTGSRDDAPVAGDGGRIRAGSRRRAARQVLYALPLALALLGGWLLIEQRRTLQAETARWYERAVTAAAHGRVDEAVAAFAAAGDFRDALDRRQRAEAELAPLREAYLDGVAALDAGDVDAAIGRLRSVARLLPGYEDAARRLADARRQRADRLRTEADAAEARRDWLAAERALASLVAADPGDAAAAVRLDTARRDHAPLVFGRDRALWLAGPDGADQTLLTDDVPAFWPTWSPDRSRVAFLSTDPEDAAAPIRLFAVGADGTGLTLLAAGLSAHTPPVWSPDGTRLAYTSFADYDMVRQEGVIGVRVVDLATGVETDLSGPDRPIAFNPSWSPDGRRLALVSKEARLGGRPQNEAGDVLVFDLATGRAQNLTEGRIPDAWSVHWSPTADDLLVYTLFGDQWYEAPVTGIRLIQAHGGAITSITTEAGVVTAPAWSPDGTRFAFVQDRTTLRVRALDGGDGGDGPVSSPEPLAGELTWNAAGDALLAVAADAAQPSLLVTLTDNGDPVARPLSVAFDDDQPFYGSPQWAPLNPAPLPAAPSVGGTGLDHVGT